MKSLYDVAGFSKQAQWEWAQRQKTILDKWLLLEPVLCAWRARHPSMSLKKLYHQIQPDFISINPFIDYGMAKGFEVISYKKMPKTTVLTESMDFPNRLLGLKIFDINQVWVSDTTYFKILNKWYYLTFIMDLYSRRIIGYHATDRLFAEANAKALQMALQNRGISQFDHKTIHHSDRGSQYKSELYTTMLRKAQIQISMGRIVFDNIHMERVNQSIKGEYLIHRNIKSEKDLLFHLPKDVEYYNNERPHLSLNKKTPADFECYLSNIPLSQRTFLEVFASKKHLRSNGKSNVVSNPAQLKLPF